jgi:hypothetical protein
LLLWQLADMGKANQKCLGSQREMDSESLHSHYEHLL